MSNLLVKEVNFENVTMTACKTREDIVFVGIRSLCEGLGVDYSSQLKRIDRDDVLPTGVVKMTIPTNSGFQETNMLNIEYLPFFLTGIKSSMCREEIKAKIIEFKLKVKDVLAKAFIKKQVSALDQLRLQYQVLEEHQEKLDKVQDKVESLESKTEYLVNNMVIEHGQEVSIKKGVDRRVKQVCYGNETPAYLNKTLRSKIYRALWRDYKEYFNITSYHDTLKKDFETAVNLIKNWKASGGLLREIEITNKQRMFDEVACTN